MAVGHEKRPLKDYLRLSEEDALVLPNFQRDFIWERSQQEALLGSFLLGLPIGALLILESDKGEFATKPLCINDQYKESGPGLYLLDGQQRLSTLKSICANIFADSDGDESQWEEAWDNLYPRLRNRWFLQLDANAKVDPLGYQDLSGPNLEAYEPGELPPGFLHRKIIHKKDSAEWFHPGFNPRDQKGEPLGRESRKNQIADEAANHGLVPLWELYSADDDALHNHVLKKIGAKRSDTLQAQERDQNVENGDEGVDKERWIERRTNWAFKVRDALNATIATDIPEISLPSSELKRAVVIFEETNKTGTRLDLFDLIVARSAKSERGRGRKALGQRIIATLQDTNLTGQEGLWKSQSDPPTRDWWSVDMGVLGSSGDEELSRTFKNLFLNVLSLLAHVEAGGIHSLKPTTIKRNAILDLSALQVNNLCEGAVKRLIYALAFAQAKLGIVRLSEVPYDLMLLPLAVALSSQEDLDDEALHARLEYWYWVSLFSGRYHTSQTEHAIEDVRHVLSWTPGVNKNPFEPWERFALAADNYSTKDILLMQDERYRPSKALNHAVEQFVLSRNPRDFLLGFKLSAWRAAMDTSLKAKDLTSGEEVDAEGALESHHIIPIGNARSIAESAKKIRNYKDHILNSPLNRTLVSASSNRRIRAMAPAIYFRHVREYAQWDHVIPRALAEADLENRGYSTETENAVRVVLGDRHDEMRKELLRHLDRLKNRFA